MSKFRFAGWLTGLKAIAAVRRSAVPVTGNSPPHNPFSRGDLKLPQAKASNLQQPGGDIESAIERSLWVDRNPNLGRGTKRRRFT
ncbi:hypothetical protein [Azospirillum argentinense]|uniref:hypothetical protein n=1 Tax=Azospirillum argentinense TaxID=2970906 RepID=UPI0010C15452|nr:hypothetical protein [Azospirillum argentinense]